MAEATPVTQSAQKTETEKKSLINRIIDAVSDIFVPIINLLSAAGILKGILAILVATGVLDFDSDAYLILNAMSSSVFYFLPMLLAYTSAVRFGANKFTACVIAGVLLWPSLTTVLETGATLSFLGLPVRGTSYGSSVIPIILAVGLQGFLEKWLDRVLPEVVRGFLTPFVSVVVVGFVTLFAFGPAGAIIGDGLAAGYEAVYSLSPLVAGLLMGGAFQLLVVFGMHWALMLIAMNNIAVLSVDTITVLFAASIFAQAGAALAVMLKSRDARFRTICASAVLSAIFGITEPALFGVNLPRKKPMIAVCIGGAVGGAIAGISGAQAHGAFVIPSVATLPVFYGDGFGPFVVSCVAGMVVAFAVTMALKFDVDIATEDTR